MSTTVLFLRWEKFLFAVVAVTFLLLSPANAQQTQQIRNAGATVLQETATGSDAIQFPEFDPGLDFTADVDGAFASSDGSSSAANINPDTFRPRINRAIRREPGAGMAKASDDLDFFRPQLNASFDGLTFRQQRLANGGNQFSIEPPDQGLCAGNGFVLESVNDVLRVFDTNGNALIGVVDLNTFYQYPPAVVRSPLAEGPSITDPSCYFDRDTHRWFHMVLTLDRVGTTPTLAGTNHLDLAVSQTSSPLGLWNIYRIPVQDDGTQGTPDHGCVQRGPNNTLLPGPCFGDYPHLGADANGIYLTTNEFSLFGPGFFGSQIYAISKRALVAGAANITVFQFNTGDPQFLLEGAPGFTVWPATTPGRAFSHDARGTEFLLSSLAVFSSTGTENRLRLWSISNTDSLNTSHPNLQLNSSFVTTEAYAVPPRSDQKSGDFPLGQCINDTTTTIASLGGFVGCWQALFATEPAHTETESNHVDSNDSRMQQVVFNGENLYAALDTALNIGGADKAGVAYFVLSPEARFNNVFGHVRRQGYLGIANNNLTYPAISVTEGGEGVIAFTLLGADHFPSAAYSILNDDGRAGPIHVAAEGLGPEDGFSAYKAEVGTGRNRWGDYGAAAADGRSIWFASEYIGQTCTLTEYIAAPFGSCGGTRASLGNWFTRISKVTP